MCGILALYLQENEKEDINKLYRSYIKLTNRGPDSGEFIINSNKITGFRRLAIMDQSNNGEQPFKVNNDILMCNGEIYNYKDLIIKYNLSCNSGSDCECIIHLYQKIGFESMIKELIGDFAIVLFTEDRIYFGRDRIGVRPLFYGFTKENNFALASYARVLGDFCPNTYHVNPGWGEYIYKSQKLDFYYYELPKPRKFELNIDTKIHDLLITSVKDRLMSDRPIGCLLSGGLDSSLITSILCKLLGPQNVRTYSIGMEGSIDLHHAKQVAEFLGTKHTEILFTPEEGFAVIPHVVRDLESYDITTIRASVGMWLLAKYIKENTNDIVLYSGEGADELFCGYLYFHYAPSLIALGEESQRLIKNLHMYDVLRADRCISSHGLELRVPFLDPRLTELSQSLAPELIAPKNNIEKHLLRTAFSKEKYLPDNVLWRRKDGMSDGISGNNGKKWFEQIQDFVSREICNKEYDKFKNTFPSKEAYYYKKIFDNIFPNYRPHFAYWMPKWVETNGDPSGRVLDIFEKNI
jgi:asparagine synthase (glutamine-hydrolysing)